MIEFIKDCEQGSDLWFKHRLGSLGGSSASMAVSANATGKTSIKLRRKLLAERLTGKSDPHYTNATMEEGTRREEESRQFLELHIGCDIEQCSLIKNSDYKFQHYSPDGYITDRKQLVELKNPLGSTQIELLETKKIQKSYFDQMQFGMMIADFDTCIFMSYVPGIKPFIKTIERDEKYIDDMLIKLQVFFDEMKKLEKVVS